MISLLLIQIDCGIPRLFKIRPVNLMIQPNPIRTTTVQQEAQLPLRNRASAMYFFVDKLLSIAVMTYSYV